VTRGIQIKRNILQLTRGTIKRKTESATLLEPLQEEGWYSCFCTCVVSETFDSLGAFFAKNRES
jgi:hypothetical protein